MRVRMHRQLLSDLNLPSALWTVIRYSYDLESNVTDIVELVGARAANLNKRPGGLSWQVMPLISDFTVLCGEARIAIVMYPLPFRTSGEISNSDLMSQNQVIYALPSISTQCLGQLRLSPSPSAVDEARASRGCTGYALYTSGALSVH